MVLNLLHSICFHLPNTMLYHEKAFGLRNICPQIPIIYFIYDIYGYIQYYIM